MGRDASGVQGMRLRGDDEVISVAIAADDADLLVVTENGYGKRTRVADYPKKYLGGMGVKTGTADPKLEATSRAHVSSRTATR